MEIIRIDGRNLPTREAVHDYFTTCLQLPGYYGRNLDALYDILTERAEPTRLVICGQTALSSALGSYADALLDTLADAAADNPALEIAYEDGQE